MVLAFAQQKEATFKDGCLSLRKSVLDKMRAKSAPGPIYDIKPQQSSMLRDIKFGTGPARYDGMKNFIEFSISTRLMVGCIF